VECRLYLVSSEQGPVAVSCEYGDEPSGSDTTDLVRCLFWEVQVYNIGQGTVLVVLFSYLDKRWW
jgi:hypothetical protein